MNEYSNMKSESQQEKRKRQVNSWIRISKKLIGDNNGK